MKTIFITGGNGLLGSKILAQTAESYHLVSIDIQKNPNSHYNHMRYFQCDIRDRKQIKQRIAKSDPDVVVHLAAYTDVDGCEIHRNEAWEVNVHGTENVAMACKELNIKMVHLSTDYVFDGEKGPYREGDKPNPIGFYGKTKLESETIVLEMLDNVIIARTMVLYGFSTGVRPNFTTWLVGKLYQKEKVSIVRDQFGTSTLADDLAQMILKIVQKDCVGIYHTAGKDLLSRYDFAQMIAEVFNLDSSLIESTTTDRLKQGALRPLRSGLITDKLTRETGYSPLSCKESLRIMRSQMEEAGYCSYVR